jgi:fumarate reductase flavoprotein subunit
MSSHEISNTKGLEADIVVIGGGGAGMAAAAAAAEKGTRVIVLEKRGLGGSSAMAFGVFAVDSPARQDECFNIAMDWAHWRLNPRLVRALIDKSGDSVRWLKEKGLEFEPGPPGSERQNVPRQIKGRGAALIKVLAQHCRNLGVQLLIRTPAKKILTDEKGKITGVLAGTRGKEFTIKTKSVVIATGGFAGNKKLLRKYCPDYHEDMERIGVPNTGDGLLMATQIGAATEGLGPMLLGMPKTLHLPYDAAGRRDTPPELAKVGIISIASEPRALLVNKRGQRFFDESLGMGANAIVRQPGNVCYSLFDSGIVRAIAKEGPARVAFNIPKEGEKAGDKLPGLERGLRQLQATRDFVSISDSWDGIANYIGCDPGTLKATIDEYNAACDQGRDPLFVKDPAYLMPLRTPPYYVIKWHVSVLNTIGGIKINEDTEVLDKQDNPIPGLYAAGVDSGGWESSTYCWRLPGHAFGFSVYSGRIAGENTADFIAGKKERPT